MKQRHFQIIPFILITILLPFVLCQFALAAQIKLAWDANTEADLEGYNVYCGTASGQYGNPIDVKNVTTYTITDLTEGQRYYLVVTAYNTSKNESSYSNEVNGLATNGDPGITVTTNPAGLQVVVDGTSYSTPQTFNWTAGSSHTLSVSSPQNGPAGTRYVYSSWSDGGAQTHSITAPSSSTTYTANFTTQYRLTTSVSPSGGGTVNPAGTNWYNSGQSVSISATASAGYSFSNWSGSLSGSTNPTSLTMNGAKDVAANFTQNQYVLTVSISPSGSGSVSKNPNKSTYAYGEQVALTATANSGYAFGNWSGDTSGSSNPITITINGNKTVTANFNAIVVGYLSVTPSEGLNASGKKGGPFNPLSQGYTLQNTGGAAIGWSVSKNKSWVTLSSSSGNLTPGASATVTVSINGDASSLEAGSYSDSVNFVNTTNSNGNASRSVTLSVAPATQTYTVATDPPNLQVIVDRKTYTAPQTFEWVVGSSHTLKAPSPQDGAPGVRYVFDSWSDGGSKAVYRISASSSTTTYTAKYATQYKMNTSVNPSRAGTVEPSGTVWDKHGNTIIVSAKAAFGYIFSSWSGDLTGTSNPITITLDKPKNVTANFGPAPEEISVPNTPKGGSNEYFTGDSYKFSTGGASSNLRHSVEYQFDWQGDGNSALSPWGSATQFNIWTIAGSYNVRARARCITHPDAISPWSESLTISVEPKPLVHLLTPNGGESYLVGTTHTLSWDSGYLNPAGTIYLFYWYDGTWHPIADLQATTTSYNWTVPRQPPGLPSITPKASARSTSVWIGHWVNDGWECWDSSDSPFVILYDAWVFKISGADKGGATLLFEENAFEGYGITLELGTFRIRGNYSIDANGSMSGTYTLSDFDDEADVLGSGDLTGEVEKSSARTITLALKASDGKPLFNMTGGRLVEEPAVPADWVAEIKGDLNATFDTMTIEPFQNGEEVYSHIFKFLGRGSIVDSGSFDTVGYFYLTLDKKAYGIYEIQGAISEAGVFSGSLNRTLKKFTHKALSDNGTKYTFSGQERGEDDNPDIPDFL